MTPLGIHAIVGYETGQQRQLLPVVLTDNLIPRRQFRLAAPSLSPGTALRLFTGLYGPQRRLFARIIAQLEYGPLTGEHIRFVVSVAHLKTPRQGMPPPAPPAGVR